MVWYKIENSITQKFITLVVAKVTPVKAILSTHSEKYRIKMQ